MEQTELQDRKAQLALRVLQDQQGLMETTELQGQQVHKALLVQQAHKDLLEILDQPDRQDHKAHKAQQVQQVQPELQVHKDQGLLYKVTHLQPQKVLYGLIMILVIIGYMFGMVQTGTLLLQDLLWSLSIYS
jgi:uncharacterized protein (DUF1778 family)